MNKFYLKRINSNEFDEIYKHIEKDFPARERPPYRIYIQALDEDFARCYAMTDGDSLYGYALIVNNDIYSLNMIWYLAVVGDQRGKGIGSTLLKLINDECKDSNGMVIEVERILSAKDESEKIERTRRIKFYEKAGYVMLDNYWYLYGVPFSLMYLNYDKNENHYDFINKNADKIYRGFYKKNADIKYFKEK